ncbi:hypothetical protein ARMA_1098 [Ardenticatena maritima]|uniref:Uncharacterized protein n=1 Tax=Ardenticatena maritima TaxID=872965 RepID=A0A0M8K6B9_9CHLR|nr:hypothetical protein ARMA_1098 [Ardenticatena maritima]
MVNVTNGPHVDVRFCTYKFFLRHNSSLLFRVYFTSDDHS